MTFDFKLLSIFGVFHFEIVFFMEMTIYFFEYIDPINLRYRWKFIIPIKKKLCIQISIYYFIYEFSSFEV